jgi:RNA-directed DNA polymerase
LLRRLNQKLVGWANYFCLGRVGAAYRHVMAHTGHRLRQWLGRKYRVQGPQRARFSDRYLREDLGLVWLPELPKPRSLWAKA